MSSDMNNIEKINALKAHGLDETVNEPDFGEVKRRFNAFKRAFYELDLETLSYKEMRFLYNCLNRISNILFEEQKRRELNMERELNKIIERRKSVQYKSHSDCRLEK